MDDDPFLALLADAPGLMASLRAGRAQLDASRETRRARLILDGHLRRLADLPPIAPVAFCGIASAIATASLGDAEIVAARAARTTGFLGGVAPVFADHGVALTLSDLDRARALTAFDLRLRLAAIDAGVDGQMANGPVLIDGSRFEVVVALSGEEGIIAARVRDALPPLPTRWPAASATSFATDRGDFADLPERVGGDIDDFTVAGLVLEPGEFLGPVRVAATARSRKMWSSRRTSGDSESSRLAREIATDARDGAFSAVYLRTTDGGAPLRVEFAGLLDDHTLAGWLSAIDAETSSPQIALPYPLWLARHLASEVNLTARALRDIARLNSDADSGYGIRG